MHLWIPFVFFLGVRKGDYYRYLAEFKASEDRKEAADQSLKAYEVFAILLFDFVFYIVLSF